MQYFTLLDLRGVLGGIEPGTAEDLGYWDDLKSYDFTDIDQAKDAINRWVLDDFKKIYRTEKSIIRLKLAFRIVLTRWGYLPTGPELMGIDDNHNVTDLKKHFYLLLWEEIFKESFEPIKNIDDYVYERIDDGFVNGLNAPEDQWGMPVFRDIKYYEYALSPCRSD